MSAEVATYRFSVEECDKLGEAGIFDEDDRVELLDGEIIVMSPIGSQHAGVVMRLNAILSRRLGDRVLLNPQNPTMVDEFSEPQPDIMLLKPRADFYTTKHPGPEDILLLIEVSDTTLSYDRGRKLRKYAESNIGEAWIANPKNMTIEQFREPAGRAYAHTTSHHRGESISVAALPERFTVEELIG
ncbi:MAG: Uma2 family endonuclease [Chthoniobacterales bacterium]